MDLTLVAIGTLSTCLVAIRSSGFCHILPGKMVFVLGRQSNARSFVFLTFSPYWLLHFSIVNIKFCKAPLTIFAIQRCSVSIGGINSLICSLCKAGQINLFGF